jgi:hypothetical protein
VTAKEILDDSVRRYAKKTTFRKNKCEKEKNYRTLELAALALQSAQRRGEPDMNVYRCKLCDEFHLGHIRRKPVQWWGSRERDPKAKP